MIFGLVAVMAMVASATVFANTHKEEAAIISHDTEHTHIASQGKYCNGTVGCNCTGFSPITNGKEWQKEYCKLCGHKKSCHK